MGPSSSRRIVGRDRGFEPAQHAAAARFVIDPTPPRPRRPIRAGIVHADAGAAPDAARRDVHAAVFQPERRRYGRIAAAQGFVDAQIPAYLAGPDDRRRGAARVGEHGADQHAFGRARAGGAEIEHPVHAVNQVDVARAAVTVERLDAGGPPPAVSMSGAVARPVVGLVFGEHGRELATLVMTLDEFADQLARDMKRGLIEEAAVEAVGSGCGHRDIMYWPVSQRWCAESVMVCSALRYQSAARQAVT